MIVFSPNEVDVMRDLTPKEEKEILEFWKANPDKDRSDVVKIFETRLGIEITERRIIKIADDYMLKIVDDYMRKRAASALHSKGVGEV